jgi:hypothetical protein
VERNRLQSCWHIAKFVSAQSFVSQNPARRIEGGHKLLYSRRDFDKAGQDND